MTDKLKQALVSEEFTIIWRVAIILMVAFFTLSAWSFKRELAKIDGYDTRITALEKCVISKFVTKDTFEDMRGQYVTKEEFSDIKVDIKGIQMSLNEIARFMGQATEYMRANNGGN